MSVSFHDFLAGGVFQGYAYAYPHKTAYRHLDPPIPLTEAWASEDKSGLFLYAHLPFCEMRCGFCNLFTTSRPEQNFVTRYLDSLERQVEATSLALGEEARFARLAIGGGTPTFLTTAELTRLFDMLEKAFAGIGESIPKAIESSPGTVDPEKIACLLSRKVTRVSIGVQSFLEEEVHSLGRRQKREEVRRALALLVQAGFACVNVDLIYGVPGQTQATWQQSLSETLEFAPQEIYLYPLYVRELTGLDRKGCSPSDDRLDLYRSGRDFLLSRGYEQISMRLFRASSYRPPEGPVYCCQEDGMVGLGAGARSYATDLHYSTEYAVGRVGVQAIIEDYFTRDHERFGKIEYGCCLDREEQQRRYVLKSLLRNEGLDLTAYRAHFSTELFHDLPQMMELVSGGWAEENGACLRLNSTGMELSDVIGPWLCSPSIREKMAAFELI